MKDRIQFVRINNSYSEKIAVNIGASQGTVLRPLLFTIYINDLYEIVPDGLTSYADDTILFDSVDTWESLFVKINDYREIISYWMNSNQSYLTQTKQFLSLLKLQ